MNLGPSVVLDLTQWPDFRPRRKIIRATRLCLAINTGELSTPELADERLFFFPTFIVFFASSWMTASLYS